MKVLANNDPSIAVAFQGVRQHHDGTQYREGRTKDGQVCYIDAADNRKFELTEGRFQDQTLHVMVTEGDGTRYRAGKHGRMD